jgi:2-oxo-4-hydroxy-4-carboxy-5-ureidoimidazoline decarboxylase
MTLDDFNALDDEAAGRALVACCSSPAWVGAVAGHRPYSTMGAVLAASDAAVSGLGEEGLRAALAGHPRIGDRRVVGDHPAPAGAAGLSGSAGSAPAGSAGRSSAGSAGWSSQEQAGVSGADAAVREALAEGNARYEAAFGHIYLACATGRSGTELLAFLRARLGNDRETEWGVVASELAKINQIRLGKLIGDTDERRAGDAQ